MSNVHRLLYKSVCCLSEQVISLATQTFLLDIMDLGTTTSCVFAGTKRLPVLVCTRCGAVLVVSGLCKGLAGWGNYEAERFGCDPLDVDICKIWQGVAGKRLQVLFGSIRCTKIGSTSGFKKQTTTQRPYLLSQSQQTGIATSTSWLDD